MWKVASAATLPSSSTFLTECADCVLDFLLFTICFLLNVTGRQAHDDDACQLKVFYLNKLWIIINPFYPHSHRHTHTHSHADADRHRQFCWTKQMSLALFAIRGLYVSECRFSKQQPQTNHAKAKKLSLKLIKQNQYLAIVANSERTHTHTQTDRNVYCHNYHHHISCSVLYGRGIWGGGTHHHNILHII